MRIKLIVVAVLVALPIVGWSVAAHAQSFRTGADVTIVHEQTINSTLFASGQTINIAGTINGDVFCAGQNVDISGTVNGDVLCAAQTLHISGTVNGNIRAAGQSVTINAQVAHNLTLAGQTLTIESASRIAGDAAIGAQDATVDGTVGRDLAAGATSLTINGHINRHIQTDVTTLTLGNNAIVGGNIDYTSPHTISQLAGARVEGTISHKEPTKKQQPSRQYGALIRGSVWFTLYLVVSLLGFAMVLTLLFPQALHKATDIAVREPLKTALAGFIASIVVPVSIVILVITVVGIPLGLMILFAWLLAILLTGPLAAYYLGRILLDKTTNNPLLIMLLGAVLLLFAYFIPLLGVLVSLTAFWFGTGMIVLQFRRLPKPNYNLKNTSEVKE